MNRGKRWADVMEPGAGDQFIIGDWNSRGQSVVARTTAEIIVREGRGRIVYEGVNRYLVAPEIARGVSLEKPNQ